MIVVDDNNVRCFKAEILLTAQLRHSCIVNFIGACWSKELTCLVLEWVEKGSLADLLDDVTVQLFWSDPGPLLRLATHIGKGMEYLHAKNILHRDLKPENVLVTTFLSAKITVRGCCVALLYAKVISFLIK